MTKYIKFIGTKFADTLGLSDTDLNEKIKGKGGDDTLYGGLGNDKIKGGNGDDWIFGGGGDDDIDGGKGNDVAVYRGLFSEYTLSFAKNLNGTVHDTVAGRDGTDTLKNIEFLAFSDGIYDIANDTFQFFNHAPDVSGPVTGLATEDGAVSTLNALARASDVDGDTLSVVNVPAALPAGVSYNAATHSFTLDPANAAYQHLAQGATTTVTVNYGVSDGIATTAASASWTVTGANDAPVVSGAVLGAATEDGAASTLNALANASDADDGAVLHVVNVPAALPAGVSYNAATHSFTLDPANAAYQHLAQGATATVTVSYGVSDGLATTAASVSWTVTGINDAPVVSGAVLGAATEDGAASTLNALANASDADDGAVLHVVNVPAALPAGVSYNAATHSFTLDPANAAYQHLAQGATATVTVSYGVSDGLATTAASVSWTVTGANDAPVVSGAVLGAATEDGAASTLNALANASDADDGAVLQVVNVPTSLPAGVSYNAATHSFTLDPANDAYQYLAQNQQITVTVNYGVSDGIATTAASVSWTVTGANDAPELQNALPSGDPVFDNNSLTLNAMMAFDDVDLLDTHSVMFTALTNGSIGTFTPTVGTDSTSSGHGVVSLSYHLTKAEVDAVNGQFPDHQDYRVTIDDHHGGTSSRIVSIPLAQIISGIGGNQNNHDPVITINPAAGDTANGFVVDDVNHPNRQFIIQRLSFSDEETQQMHNVSAIGITPGPFGTMGTLSVSVIRDTDGTVRTPGGSDPDGFLAASPIGGVLMWNYQVAENKIQAFGANEFYTDQFQVTLTDNSGGFTTQLITVSIAGQNDAPVLAGDADLAVTSLHFDGTFSNTSPYPYVPGPYQTHGFGFIDPDRHDHHTVLATLDLAHSTVNVAATFEAHLTKETYSLGPTDTTGSLSWVYQLQDLAAPYLAGHEGEQRIQTWDIFIDDGHGGTHVPFVVTFNSAPALVGSNPTNPVVFLGGGYSNGPNSSAPVGLGQVGAFAVYDPDPNNHITLSPPVIDYTLSTVAPPTMFDAYYNSSDGFVHWQHTLLESQTPYLPGKEDLPRQLVYDITLSDEHGGVTTIPFTISYNSSATIGTPTFDYLSAVDPAGAEYLGATTSGDTTVLRFDFHQPVVDGLLFESFIIDGNLPFFDPDMDHHVATRQFIGEESTNGNASFGHLFADSIAVTEQGTTGQVHFQYGVTASFVPGEHVTDVFVVDLNDGSHHYFKFDMFA